VCQLLASPDFQASFAGLTTESWGAYFPAHQTFGAWINGPQEAAIYSPPDIAIPALQYGQAWHMATWCQRSTNTLTQIVSTVPQSTCRLEFSAIGGTFGSSSGADKVDVSLVDGSSGMVILTERFSTTGDVEAVDGVWDTFTLDFTAAGTITKLVFSTLQVGSSEACITIANVTMTGVCPTGH
jgi:hypothetical protein